MKETLRTITRPQTFKMRMTIPYTVRVTITILYTLRMSMKRRKTILKILPIHNSNSMIELLPHALYATLLSLPNLSHKHNPFTSGESIPTTAPS